MLIVKTDADAAGGAFALVDLRAARGYETPYHVHYEEEEYFYVLDGEIERHYGDGESVVAGPRDTVFLPRDVPHGFRVVSDDSLRMLATVTPAGPEDFFVEGRDEAETRTLPPAAESDVESLVTAPRRTILRFWVRCRSE